VKLTGCLSMVVFLQRPALCQLTNAWPAMGERIIVFFVGVLASAAAADIIAL
jgi:hypothetical protein